MRTQGQTVDGTACLQRKLIIPLSTYPRLRSDQRTRSRDSSIEQIIYRFTFEKMDESVSNLGRSYSAYSQWSDMFVLPGTSVDACLGNQFQKVLCSIIDG